MNDVIETIKAKPYATRAESNGSGQSSSTPQAYLLLEEQAAYKSEYYRGEIWPMAGGTPNHNRIAMDFAIAADAQLIETPCEMFGSDMRLFIEAHTMYTYPDVMIVCGGLAYAPQRTDTLTNPTVIVEVLSPSTETYDRTTKFKRYQALASLQEYILVEQERPRIEQYRRAADGEWSLTVVEGLESTLRLESVGIALPLTRIYRRVMW